MPDRLLAAAGDAPPNIIHDTDINQVVNELKAAGAEAISVNRPAPDCASPVRCAGPTVFSQQHGADAALCHPGHRRRRDAATLINLPGGVGDQIKAFDPAMIKVQTRGAGGRPGLARPAAAQVREARSPGRRGREAATQ